MELPWIGQQCSNGILIISGNSNNCTINRYILILDYLCHCLRSKLGEKNVVVAVTPNGYADGIAEREGKEYFVMPEEKTMKMTEFLDRLNEKESVKLSIY